MSQPRIAVLECDTPIPSVIDSRGTYGDILKTLLVEGAARARGQQPGLSPQISTYDVVTAQEYPKIDDVDAVLLSGSSKCPYTENKQRPCAGNNATQSTTHSMTTLGFCSWSLLCAKPLSTRGSGCWAYVLAIKLSPERWVQEWAGIPKAGSLPWTKWT